MFPAGALPGLGASVQAGDTAHERPHAQCGVAEEAVLWREHVHEDAHCRARDGGFAAPESARRVVGGVARATVTVGRRAYRRSARRLRYSDVDT
eukprot:1482385-Prymnesium_polylepis.1